MLTICTTHAQLPHGNWFLRENTNEWVFGLYEKLAYYKNDFWPYRIISAKENETKLLLQKGGAAVSLILIANDSLLELSDKGVVQTLTNQRRRMAAVVNEQPPARSNIVYIKGYVDSIPRNQIQFTVRDLLLGKSTNESIEAGKNGWFNIRLTLPKAASELIIEYGNRFEFLICEPGDTTTLYLGNTGLVAGGTHGAFNNEYRDYISFANHLVYNDKTASIARTSNEQQFREYLLGNKKMADSLLQSYRATYTMSDAVYQRAQQNNKYEFANTLLRYLWLHEPNKRVPFSTESAQLVNNFTAPDNNAHLAGYYFDGFVHELMNTTVVEYLSDRTLLDSLVVAEATPGSVFDYLQQYDKTMTPAQLKDIDRLLKYGPRFTKTNGKLSLNFNATDTLAQKKIVSQFTVLLNWMSNSDYFLGYFANLELVHKLNKIDSLYPKSSFRDYLLGHYLYKHFLEKATLIFDDKTLYKIQSLCNDTTLYNLVVAENTQNRLQFEGQLYESLVPPAASSKEETVLNRIARQHKGKVVYVDVWATWCVPCIEQFPYSKDLKKDFGGKPVDFVYLCCDSDITDWQNMIKKHSLPGQQLLLTPDEKARLLSKYNFGSYPRYMIISRQGKLISSNSFAPQQKEILVPMIEELLGSER